MRVGSPSAFAEARQEIQLWPAAAVGYYLSNHYSLLMMGIFVVTLFTGAITYKVHGKLRDIIKQEKELTKVRQRVSREDQSSRVRMVMRTFDGLWKTVTPESQILRVIVWCAIVSNLFVGLYLFWWVSGEVFGQVSLSVPAISLFSLPMLMVATTVASIILSA